MKRRESILDGCPGPNGLGRILESGRNEAEFQIWKKVSIAATLNKRC